MADAYLNVAERVLLTSRRPLRPREIIHQAYADALLPWHLHGSTQDKTLHARMSEDVARNPEASRFFRTGPGRFFLKSLIYDPTVPDAFKQPYCAPPRRKELRRDRILSFDSVDGVSNRAAAPLVETATIRTELEEGRYRYRTFEELTTQPGSLAAHSFVLVFHGNAVLSYRCGKFSPTTNPLYGMRSIGLGGAIYASHRDLLFEDMFGIIASGINELGYGIGLPRQLSERARYENEVQACLGVMLPSVATRPAVLHIVMGYECPHDFLPSKAALSVNDLRWIDVDTPAKSLDDYDETSRILFVTKSVTKVRAIVAAHDRG